MGPPEIAAELAKIDAANAAKGVKMQALQEAYQEVAQALQEAGEVAIADGATEVRSESWPTYCTPGEHAAATKIQAAVRGKATRIQVAAMKGQAIEAADETQALPVVTVSALPEQQRPCNITSFFC